MHWIFAVVRFYPYWALPVAFVLLELGFYFRRTFRAHQYLCFAGVGCFVLTTALWFIFRGDLNSDAWVKAVLQ